MTPITNVAETVTIGGDLTVGRIGYGAMQLTGDQVWGDYPDHDGGIDLLRHVVDSGVTFIDTADVYGPHSNEELIREALHPYPADLVIATKGGFVRGGRDYSTLDAVGNPNYLRQCVHMSLRRLGLDRIDLYYLHSGTATDAPFEDQVGVLAELQAQGLIHHVGLSNVTVEQFESARGIVESLTAVAWEAWLAAISIVLRGFMRCAIRRWLSGWIILSSVETWYQVGFLFHAGSVTVSAKVEPTGAFWVTAMTSASSAGRSWQKVSRNLSGGIQTNPSESGAMLATAAGGISSVIAPSPSPASVANAAM